MANRTTCSNARTTQTSFSRRCAGLPDREAATCSASCVSWGDRSKKDSGKGYQRADLLSHPRRHLPARTRELLHRLRRQHALQLMRDVRSSFAPEPRQRTNHLAGRTSGECQLPPWGVPKFDRLGTEPQTATRPRRQVNHPCRNLRGKAQCVGSRRAAGSNRLAGLCLESVENGLDTGRPRAESGLDRTHVQAAACPQQLASSHQPRQALVDGRTTAQMKERFGINGGSFGQGYGLGHNTCT